MAELVHSIHEIGVLQPVVVRPISPEELAGMARRDGAPGQVSAAGQGATAGQGAAAGQDGQTFQGNGEGQRPDDLEQPMFELIMGERRWRATQAAGLAVIPAIIKDTHDDDLLRDALLENLHRSELNALEEAAAYQQLLDDFGCTHDELAGRIGRSRPQISNTLRLLKLPPPVQRRVAAGVLSAGHARALLGLVDREAMERLAQRIAAEGLSVRNIEEIVAMGDEEHPRPRKPRAGAHHPQLDDHAAKLSDRFDTRVRISLGQRKGKLTFEFASVEDLERIVQMMGRDLIEDTALVTP
jgi:ParB family chromosome partitioning protein